MFDSCLKVSACDIKAEILRGEEFFNRCGLTLDKFEEYAEGYEYLYLWHVKDIYYSPDHASPYAYFHPRLILRNAIEFDEMMKHLARTKQPWE